MSMKVFLPGTMKNAASVMRSMLCEMRERMSPEDFESFETRHQPEAEIGILEMIEKHARETIDGKHTIEEFTVFYCLKDDE